MSIDFIKKLLLFLLFVMVQALVLNHIHLFGVATPLLYVYFVLQLERNTPRWAVLLWAFCLGLSIDTFANTAGVAAGSLTLVGLLQPYVLMPFVPRDAADNISPSVRSLGLTQFFYYSLVLITVFCLVFFALEMLTFFNWLYFLECVGGSMVLTLLLVLVLENLRSR